MCKEIKCNDCGIILSSRTKAKNRNKCIYCRKRENKEYYKFNKEEISRKRKEIRKKEKTVKKCMVCMIEFQTARDYQVTCASSHCTMIYQRVKKRLYDSKKKEIKNAK